MSERDREAIAKALEIAEESGQVDGGHHKMWVIDQMIRALTGCPLVEKTGIGSVSKEPFTYEVQGESAAYQEFVNRATFGEDGPHTYEWDTGIAP